MHESYSGSHTARQTLEPIFIIWPDKPHAKQRQALDAISNQRTGIANAI